MLVLVYFAVVATVAVSGSTHPGAQPFGGFLGDPYIEHPEKPTPNVATEWFDQQLDHFDNNDVRTWKQRYYMRTTEFDGTGPVFLMIGGKEILLLLLFFFAIIKSSRSAIINQIKCKILYMK